MPKLTDSAHKHSIKERPVKERPVKERPVKERPVKPAVFVKIPYRILQFYQPCIPPTTTHQAKVIVTAATGRAGGHRIAVTRDTKQLKDAIKMIDSVILAHRPWWTLSKALRITMIYVWPYTGGVSKSIAQLECIPKLTIPDADNLFKTCCDRLVALRVIEKDSIAYDIRSIKLYGKNPGIYLKIEELDELNADGCEELLDSFVSEHNFREPTTIKCENKTCDPDIDNLPEYSVADLPNEMV